MASNGFFSPQRNAHRNMNGNTGTTLKRRSDNRGCGSSGGFQEDRIRYAPPQKRARSQTQTQTQRQFRSANPGRIPLYHDHGSNMSRVSQSYNYKGDVIDSNSSNSFPFALRYNDSLPSMPMPMTNTYGIPNPQRVPLPLPYRKLGDDVSFDSLPEWAPNQSLNRSIPNFPNFVPNIIGDKTGGRFASQAPEFANFQNPMAMNHSNMFSIVSQVIPQPIVSKDLADLLNSLNNDEKEKENDDVSSLGMSFDNLSLLKVRHESVIKSLYADMPRQCSSCGVRFKSQEEHSNHMDWHVRKNRMAKDANKTSTRLSQTKPKKSRDWFASSSLWLIAATGGAKEAGKASFSANGETQKKEEEEKQHVVPADENQKTCALCEEPFEEFFSHEADDWLYKDAVYLKRKEHTSIVHAKCMPETRKGPAKDSREPMVMPIPSVASALVC